MKQIKINVFAPSTPHSGQKEVLKALDKGERFVLIRAGRKWFKTSLMVSWLFEKALETGLVCPYVAPNRVQAKNIAWDDHISRMLDEFAKVGLPYKKNEVELSISLPNGGKVQLLGVENKEALRGISNWGAIACDEYDDWLEDIFPSIIRPNLITYRAPCLIGGTPKGFRNIYRLEQEGIFKHFHFRTQDNPLLPKDELKQLEAEYKKMGMAYYRQEILADYVKPVGVVYEEWDLEKQFIPIDYDPVLPLHLTFDFGVHDPTAVIWIQRMGGEFRAIDYYEGSDANVEHFVSVIKGKPYKTPDLFTGDPAGKARSIVTGTSPIEEYAKHGINISFQEGVRIPEQIRVAHRYMPSFFISNKLERLRDCLLNYRYPGKKSTVIDQSDEIPLHDEFSHGMRALEYYFVGIEGDADWGKKAEQALEYFQKTDSHIKRKWY